MRVSDIVFAAHLVSWKVRKSQRPKFPGLLTGKIEAVTKMD